MSGLELIERDDVEAQPAAQPQRQLSTVEYAVQKGASVAEVRALLELQVQLDTHKLAMMQAQRVMDKEDRAEAAILAYRRDFAAFRGEAIVIPKSKHVDRGIGGSFWQAEFSAFSAMLSPALSRYGFSFRHDQQFGSKPWTTDGIVSDVPWVYVTCFLEHKDGHSEKLTLEGPPADTKVNTPVQNMQVTASVLKRQSLAAITGTATGDEDDENKLKQRGKSAPSPEKEAEREALLQAGRDEALNGTAAWTAWWGSITSRQRTDLSAEVPAMKRAAAQADKAGGAK